MHCSRGAAGAGLPLPRLGGTGSEAGHDEPYDPLVFALHAMMSLPVSWALELLSCMPSCLVHCCSPPFPVLRCCSALLLCVRVYARLEGKHMRMLSVRAAAGAGLYLSSLLLLCSCWPACTGHWTLDQDQQIDRSACMPINGRRCSAVGSIASHYAWCVYRRIRWRT